MNQQVIDLLRQAATHLGTTSEYLWAVAVHQGYIELYRNIGFAIFWLLSAIVCTFRWNGKLALYRSSDNTTSYSEKETRQAWTIVFGIASAVLYIGFLVCVSLLQTPESYALQRIIGR